MRRDHKPVYLNGKGNLIILHGLLNLREFSYNTLPECVEVNTETVFTVQSNYRPFPNSKPFGVLLKNITK